MKRLLLTLSCVSLLISCGDPKEAKSLYRRAVEAEVKSGLEGAIPLYRTIAQKFPRSEVALKASERLAAFDKHNKELEIRSLELFQLAANNESELGLEAAIPSYRELVRLYPGTEAARIAQEKIVASQNQAAEEKRILGQWEREEFGDAHFAGMQIVISKSKDGYEARLVYVPPVAAAKFGFEVGDIKWMSLSKVSNGRYYFKDLAKSQNAKSRDVRYVDTYLEFISSQEIRTRQYAKSELLGTEQRWRRKL